MTNDILNEQWAHPACPEVPPDLMGPLHPNISDESTANYTESSILDSLTYRPAPGGQWAPPDCRSHHQIAVIIPYRDRHHQLLVLLAHLHPILQKQQLDYRIFVIEQVQNLVACKNMYPPEYIPGFFVKK